MAESNRDRSWVQQVTNDIDAAAFCAAFFDVFVRNGYGSLPKREIELLVLDLLLKHSKTWSVSHPPVYELARTLKVSPRRLQTMLDDLAYRDEAKSEDWCRNALKQILKTAEIIKDESWVQFQIDDGLVRDFATAAVRKDYGIVDSSFNAAIVKLSGEKFAALALSLLDQEARDKVLGVIGSAKLKARQNKRKSKGPIRLFMDAFAESAGKEAGQKSVKLGFALLTMGASEVTDVVQELMGKNDG